jgi:hypothetical protein
MERPPFPEKPSDQARSQWLEVFVLGTSVEIHPVDKAYGDAPHDDWQDKAPMPNEYPSDAP